MKEKMRLTVELVPTTSWHQSIFQIYKASNWLDKWRAIKNELFKIEGRRCWICNRERGRLEAHEFWEYDDKNHIQRLVAIHHLCDMCHKIKHIGLWCHTKDGERMLKNMGLTREDLINHFCKVNNCTKEEFEKYEDEAFRVWRVRSKYKWKQILGKYDPNKT